MFTLTHEGENVGTTKLEGGDPSTQEVSGVFYNVGGGVALAGWLKSIGGHEDEGVVFIVLNNDFTLIDADGTAIAFTEGNLIAIPDDDEAYLDINGLSEEDYTTYFAEHISAME
jgi:hypothetical protein